MRKKEKQQLKFHSNKKFSELFKQKKPKINSAFLSGWQDSIPIP